MKKKRLISLIAAFSLVFTGVTAYVPSGVYAEENVQMENLVQGKAAIASSTANGYGPEYAVDGVTSETVQWNSADMKNWGAASGNSKDSEEQTAQWIQIDRGENAEEEDISSIKLWYNVKVWPMEYEIYTADESTLTEGSTDVDLNNWTSLVSVSRPSANGQVANGEGQNIADTSANTDTITAASSPALASDKKLKRYVLMYIRKVNAQAVGNNVNLREIQIFSQNESADVNGTLAGITADSLKVQDGQITVDTGTARGVNAYVRGSSLENVVSNDGQISDYNIGDRNVTLLVRVENKKNPDEYAEKNIEVTIPDHSGNYPEGNFPEVSAPNEKPEVIPSLQEWYGYEGDFELTESSKIIYNDTADAGIREAAWNMQEDLKEIAGLDLTVEEGNAPASSNDIYIESQTDDTYGVGDEGYLLKTDDEGVHIGDDGVAHQSVVAEAPEDDPVEQEDHHAVAQLRYAVGKAQRDQPLVDAPVHPELHKVEGVVSAQEVAQIDDARQKLGKTCGEGRAPYAQIQHKDGDIVQHAVGQTAGDDRQNCQTGIAVGLDQHLHVIGDDEAQREGSQTPEIVDGILIRYALCAQQHGERLQKYENEDGDGQADARQQHDVLREQAIGLLALVLSQIDGDDGAGTDGEDDADGEQHIGERYRQIHRCHGVFAYALGDHQPVHDGVQAENHEGCHRSGYEMQKL